MIRIYPWSNLNDGPKIFSPYPTITMIALTIRLPDSPCAVPRGKPATQKSYAGNGVMRHFVTNLPRHRREAAPRDACVPPPPPTSPPGSATLPPASSVRRRTVVRETGQETGHVKKRVKKRVMRHFLTNLPPRTGTPVLRHRPRNHHLGLRPRLRPPRAEEGPNSLRLREEAGDQGRKGLTRRIPQPSKSAVLRVASGILWSSAVAAMSLS